MIIVLLKPIKKCEEECVCWMELTVFRVNIFIHWAKLLQSLEGSLAFPKMCNIPGAW